MVLFILPISLPLRFRFPPSQHFGSFTFLLSFAKRLQHNTPTKTRVRELVAISRTGDGREFARKKRCVFSVFLYFRLCASLPFFYVPMRRRDKVRVDVDVAALFRRRKFAPKSFFPFTFNFAHCHVYLSFYLCSHLHATAFVSPPSQPAISLATMSS